MSQITKDDIKKIARLSKIKVADENLENLAQQLTSITNFVATLKEVNTDNVAIVNNVHDAALRLNKDEINDGNISDDILKNSNNAKYGYFTVPKVIE